jgi:hypothetical protein
MTQIKVIITEGVVYTTLYKTIHAAENFDYGNQEQKEVAETICKALAFSLACRDLGTPSCAIVDFDDKKMGNAEIFQYLNECHP